MGEAMSEWRHDVSEQRGVSLVQWNLLSGSRIITSTPGTHIPVSRFFLASFCPEDINLFLDLLTWDRSASPQSADTQTLVDLASAGDFFCAYHDEEESYSSSGASGLCSSLIMFITVLALYIMQ